MTEYAIVVAMAENGVIGRDNALPWHLPEDLAHFKSLTMGCPLIMGRLTYESIGRLLPGRSTIILSSNPNWSAPEGAFLVSDLESAVQIAQREAQRMQSPRIVFAGGGKLYEQTLLRADHLYVTEVHTAVEGDAVFPPISRQHWRERARVRHTPKSDGGLAYSFVEYERRSQVANF